MELPSAQLESNGPGTHPLVSLFAAVFWVFLWALSWLRFLIAFATISAPRFIYAILSYSLTLTLNFWSFVIIFLASAIVLNYWIRFRYLNTYAYLKEPPLLKPDAKELHPDVITTDDPPNFHNYLDEFLQAVRVFGFLEKPVFHELARHLQTRRLIAGDSLSLDQDKSFYCVVDGIVQVFARTGENSRDRGIWEEEDTNGYQLLNEVGSGGTLSSLFTILSLFTEDVKISWQDDAHPDSDTDSGLISHSISNRTRRADSDVSRFELDAPSSNRRSRSRRRSMSSSGLTVHPVETNPASPSSGSQEVPGLQQMSGSPLRARARSALGNVRRRPEFVNHGTVARATEDTTLAVIPAEAFRRVTKKFPKATAHIVQVILTRFSRVTFNAAHKYLGLTTEVLRTEKAINDIACHPLPRSFYEGGGVQRLRQRFDGRHPEETANVDIDYFSSSHSSKGSSESHHILPDATFADSPQPDISQELPPFRSHSSRYMVQAGDLHTSVGNNDTYRPLHRTFSHFSNGVKGPDRDWDRPVQEASRLPSDDFNLRDEVMSCIAKSIGLLQPPLSGGDSNDASPAFSATEGGTTPTTFTSSFSSLSLLETGDDASSITGGSSIACGTENLSTLDNELEILFFAAGSILARAGERHAGLFYVIDGFLDISLPSDEDNRSESRKDTPKASGVPSLSSQGPSIPKSKAAWSAHRTHRDGTPTPVSSSSKVKKHLFTVKSGGIAGYLASLCSTASYVDITAKTDTYVGFLPYKALERLLEKRPIVLLTLAKRLISLLSPLVLHIDASLDWMQVNAGQVLWRPGDVSDSFYIVINGRLRAISEKDGGKVTIVGEYGQGDPVGELDVITNCPRRNTVHAIRDTELVRMPLTLFNAISARNPQTTAQLLRLIASRVREEVDSSSTVRPADFVSELGRNNVNLKTIAILPAARNVPVEAFSKKLQSALESIGSPTSYLNQSSVSSHLGRHAFTKMGKLKVAGWLADQEQQYRTVLYVANSAVNSPWTQTCIRQADYVMVIGMGDDPSLGEYERLLLSMKTTARKELVILHPDRSVVPGSTREWLKNRPWIHQHIHVELPGIIVPIPRTTHSSQNPAAVAALKNLKDKVQIELQKYRGGRDIPRPQRPSHSNDFVRLARRICGKSIGVVLGGGGARGISHLGVLRAMEEYGIPIDHIAGTSIGALVGGLYAREGDLLSSALRVKQFSGRMSNIWRMLSDVTYPIVAYTTGHEFNRSIYKAFYDLHIEDMWLPFFCNTTNILTSRMDIHETGYAWRFIRASMTLVGLLPPLSDNGNLLVDGGYIDNLPVSAMFAMGASAVFASDVGSLDDNSPRNFGDTVSGWWLLLNRWNPFSSTRNIPAITEIQSRLAYVSSVKTLQDVKVTRGCLYMQMPVQEYGTLQFNKFEEIQSKGYHAAMSMLEKWDEEGRLPAVLDQGTQGERSKLGKKRGKSLRRNSV